jgi:hypothetical protein
MATSINGWPVLDDGDPRIATGIIPGVGRPVTMARACLPVFLHFYAAWQKEMGPRMSIKTGPIDGWEVRQSRVPGAGFSNHASASACDVLYDTVLPADGEPHMTAAEKAKLDKILSRYVTSDGHRILANGEWWKPPYCDGMHTELSQGWDRGALRNTTAADVANVIKKLGIKPDGTVSPLQKIINVIKPKPKAPLSAHQAHLAHLANTGQKPPAPLPPKPVPPKPAPLTAHQLHMQHLANTGAKPVAAASKGPDWLIKFLRAHKVPNERAWFAIGMRESGGDPSCIYPAGSPKNGWANDQAPYWDSGWVQVNNRHYADVARRYGSDMRAMLNAENCLDFALKHLAWSDWGLEITSDAAGNATGYKFNWSGWPSPYMPGQSGAISAEAGFKEWWDAYPTYAAKVK